MTYDGWLARPGGLPATKPLASMFSILVQLPPMKRALRRQRLRHACVSKPRWPNKITGSILDCGSALVLNRTLVLHLRPGGCM